MWARRRTGKLQSLAPDATDSSRLSRKIRSAFPHLPSSSFIRPVPRAFCLVPAGTTMFRTALLLGRPGECVRRRGDWLIRTLSALCRPGDSVCRPGDSVTVRRFPCFATPHKTKATARKHSMRHRPAATAATSWKPIAAKCSLRLMRHDLGTAGNLDHQRYPSNALEFNELLRQRPMPSVRAN